ncbi:MAG: peptide ABC transporter substrate-binding protein [Gemmatimonadetes bacterium]|nr:peptide ABC transporter substrate-binding protein [Gemmatimonadota bacterium]
MPSNIRKWCIFALATILAAPTALLCASLLGAAVAAQSGQEKPAQVNSVGVTLPADAAPPHLQHLRTFELNARYMDRATSSYQKVFGFAVTNEPLTRVDRDFNLLPAAATHWEVSEDGLTWTFHLQKDLVFGDGRPVTAYDYEDSFRRWADPKTGFDFEWYYRPIKNWGEVVSGRMPLDSLGVEAPDPYTIAFTTTLPTPYAPELLNYSWVTPTHLFEKYGAAWSTRPETHMGNGPFRLKEWTINDRIVLEPSPTYRGPNKPYLERITAQLFNAAAQPPFLAAYEGGEVDYIALSNQAEINRVKSNPALKDHLNTYVDFQTFYLLMDTYNPPFNDRRVRQAFSHAVDQASLMNSALRDIALPASSMSPPGFPAADPKGLASFQAYDPELARKLLAEAGYPDGKGFPAVNMWLRGEPIVINTAAEAVQAMLKQSLNIEIGVRNAERKVFTETMNAKELTLALIPYRYDYVDASNLLTLWLSNGRHPWYNERFEELVLRANVLVGDPHRRTELYQEAEEILVRDVGGVFLWHTLINEMWRPYVRGAALETNRWGYRAWRGNQMLNLMPTLYISEDVQDATSKKESAGFWDWLTTR